MKSFFNIRISSQALYKDPKALKATMRSLGGEIASKARSLIRTATKQDKKGVYVKEDGPPISRSGNLLKSIKSSVSKSGDSVTIRDVAYYSRFLEGGTNNGIRSMKPHPFLGPAAKSVLNSGAKQRIVKSVVQGISFRKTK
jgi:HK97 gp10 family phage protein